MTMAVSSTYFVQDQSGLVKIGHTSDVPKRVANIQCNSSRAIRLLRVIEGGRSVERWLHDKFAKLRVHGEWFAFHPDMLTVQAGDFASMSPIQFIRTQVFKAKQSEFALIAGKAQSTIARWENGGAPSLDEMRAIRNEALARGLPWSDSWFFEAPKEAA